MKLYGLSDALWAEYRPDRNTHWPATLVAPNGSLCCCDDYDPCAALAREIIEVSL